MPGKLRHYYGSFLGGVALTYVRATNTAPTSDDTPDDLL